MKTNPKQITQIICRLDRNSTLTNEMKSEIMQEIDYEYTQSQKNSDSKPSSNCHVVINGIRASNLPDEGRLNGQSIGAWNQIIMYLEDKQNWDRPFHFVLCETLNKYVLNHFYHLRYEMGFVSGIVGHRWNIFTRELHVWKDAPLSHTFGYGLVTGLCSFFASPFTITGALINIATRAPLDIKEQKQFFDKLSSITQAYEQNDRAKLFLINAIIVSYGTHHCTSSSSSTLNELFKYSEDINFKWQAIEKYVLELDHDENYLKNNGKALFLCIRDVIMNHNVPNFTQVASIR